MPPKAECAEYAKNADYAESDNYADHFLPGDKIKRLSKIVMRQVSLDVNRLGSVAKG
ncbi:hypothetical protein HMPREF0758_2026 [Serratia odorifera DSM 4582]|uniref:Uncharacterized protein n=1 Tax=Serratia odorifera DSM 4582 TaxID=667129 RepID=D4E1H6_SEROD|nr:hypothetical protein HMPREF0758_2026 [Serratia odorifera DSM 4582]